MKEGRLNKGARSKHCNIITSIQTQGHTKCSFCGCESKAPFRSKCRRVRFLTAQTFFLCQHAVKLQPTPPTTTNMKEHPQDGAFYGVVRQNIVAFLFAVTLVVGAALLLQTFRKKQRASVNEDGEPDDTDELPPWPVSLFCCCGLASAAADLLLLPMSACQFTWLEPDFEQR